MSVANDETKAFGLPGALGMLFGRDFRVCCEELAPGCFSVRRNDVEV